MTIELDRFASIESAADALADALAVTIRESISDRGRAQLAVSGGRTPGYVFQRLRGQDVNWGRVVVTLTDERWVPGSHPDSNERLVKTELLRGPAAAATFVPLYGGEESPAAGHSACEQRLLSLGSPLDSVYLGLGEDGHFASLFPGDPAVEVRGSICVAVAAKNARLPRMSLTVDTILRARKIFLLYSGAEKHRRFSEAMKPGGCYDAPLRLLVSQDRTPMRVFSAP